MQSRQTSTQKSLRQNKPGKLAKINRKAQTTASSHFHPKESGDVSGYLAGAASGVHATARSSNAVVDQIRNLARNYNVTSSVAARILDVSPKTYSRYLENSKSLSDQQKDRLNVVASILQLGKRVLGNEEEVKKWLFRPVHSIENQRPIDLIVSESGRRRVENVLLQIEGGAY